MKNEMSEQKRTHPHGEHVCICPECKEEVTVDEGVKCHTQECPECGAPMVAKEAGDWRLKMPKELEKGRGVLSFDFDELEVRSVEDTGEKMIRGYGAVYDKLSADLGGFKELFKQGAFTDAIKNDDIRSLRDHVPSYILGRKKSGTLTLTEEERGLYYEVKPPDTSYARDLMVSIERRDVTGGSIIFQVDGTDGQRWFVDGKEVDELQAFMSMWDDKKHKIERHISKARLLDIGPVTFPAYTQTDVKVRSLMEAAKEQLSIKPDEHGPAPKEGADESLDLYQRKIAIAEL